MKTCPYCRSKIPEDASKCAYCAEWLARPATGPPPSIGRLLLPLLLAAAIAGLILVFLYR